MKKLILVLTLIITAVVGIGCKDENEVAESFGITETDSAGHFVGYIDRNDWDPRSYRKILFGSNFWTPADTSVGFGARAIGDQGCNKIYVYSYGPDPLSVSSEIRQPFSFAPSQFVIAPRTMDSLAICFTLVDSSQMHASDVAYLTFGGTERIKFSLQVNPGVQQEDPGPPMMTYHFLPAFPNPANREIFFLVASPRATNIIITIQSTMKSLSYTVRPGTNRLSWDLRNDFGQRFAPGVYRATLKCQDRIFGQGDIEIH